MSGSALPIAVAHGEGRARFSAPSAAADFANKQHLVPLRYVDNATLEPTEVYPFNPNGSPEGIAGVRSEDGRVLAVMPHPERTVMGGVASWVPEGKGEEWGAMGPWFRVFQSARRWVG